MSAMVANGTRRILGYGGIRIQHRDPRAFAREAQGDPPPYRVGAQDERALVLQRIHDTLPSRLCSCGSPSRFWPPSINSD
ncbi:hypothetical protein D3C84_964160 [compost metagenome]